MQSNYSPDLKSPIITIMTRAVSKAARSIRRDYNELEKLQVSSKSLGNFVTSADLNAEKILIDELKKAKPGFGFISEEAGVIKGEDPHYNWVIDPIDGTHNFMHGIPHFCTTVALEKNGKIVAGVTYSPILDELFWAEEGRGAYMNSTRLRVSGRKQLDEALVCYALPELNSNHHYFKGLEKLSSKVSGVRRFGCSALDLAYIAAGRFDMGVLPGHYWDYAAGILFIQEAGGFSHVLYEKEFKVYMCGNTNFEKTMRSIFV